MQTVSIHEAKTHLSRLLKQVQEGQEIVITSSGKPVAKLSALAAPVESKRNGDIQGSNMDGPDFDAPVSEKWLLGETDHPFERDE